MDRRFGHVSYILQRLAMLINLHKYHCKYHCKDHCRDGPYYRSGVPKDKSGIELRCSNDKMVSPTSVHEQFDPKCMN